MDLFKRPPAIETLDELLDRERQAILRGDLNSLVRLAPEKERLLTQLPGANADEWRISRLRQKADRNQDLLRAVARGIKAARQAVMRAQNPNEGFTTYDKGGRAHKLDQRNTGLEKRA